LRKRFACKSISGPTASDAIINPIACASAMLPFCFGVNENFFERSGRIVPSIAAIMP